MPAYRLTRTIFLQPALQPAPGAPAQGEWVNGEPSRLLEGFGVLEPLAAQLELSGLGQGSRRYFRWRGRLPEGAAPEPGWELEIEGSRYRVYRVEGGKHALWRLSLERIG